MEPAIKKWEFNSIKVSHAVSTFDDYSTFSSLSAEEAVRLHFGIKGDYSFTHKQLGKNYDLIGGHHNIMYSDGLDIEVQNKSMALETFGINFPKDLFIQFTQNSDDLLRRFSERIIAGQPAIVTEKWGTIDSPIQKVIDEMLQNRFTGELANIFSLSKSLELLVLCVDNYQQWLNEQPVYIKTKSDKERIIAARDYINDRVATPPNLSEIAQAVGLNEFKLKHGFKEIFRSTLFGYLTDRRLHLSRQYLLDTEKTAAEVAIHFGYSSPQHFSTQFRNKFGVTPNSIRNNP